MAKKTVKPTKITDKVAKKLGMPKGYLEEKQATAKRLGQGETIKKKAIKAVKKTTKGKAADKKRSALPAGIRISKNGRIYTERRSNRAD
jgi:hypothetical protein